MHLRDGLERPLVSTSDERRIDTKAKLLSGLHFRHRRDGRRDMGGRQEVTSFDSVGLGKDCPLHRAVR